MRTKEGQRLRDKKVLSKKRRAAAVVAVLVMIATVVFYFGRAKPEKTTGPVGGLSPASTFAAFVDAFNARDVDATYALFSSQVRAQHPKVEVEGYLEAARTFGAKVTKWEVLEENMTDNSAVLKIQIQGTFLGERDWENDLIPFVWEDGKWLFDKWIEEWESEKLGE
jgi:hypothetical protein